MDRFSRFLITFIVMAATLAFASHCAKAQVQNYELVVELPAKYRWADGTALTKADYSHTMVIYGPCSGDDALITQMLGGVSISNTRTAGKIFYVKRGTYCMVATVVGPKPEAAILGRSNLLVFSVPDPVRPDSSTIILKVK